MDIWTNRTMRAHMGIPRHFRGNFQLQSVMFACRRLKGAAYCRKCVILIPGNYNTFQFAGKVLHHRQCSQYTKSIYQVSRCGSGIW